MYLPLFALSGYDPFMENDVTVQAICSESPFLCVGTLSLTTLWLVWTNQAYMYV